MSHFFESEVPPAPTPRRRHRYKGVLAVLIALVVLGGGGWFAIRGVSSALAAPDYAPSTAADPVTVKVPEGSTLTDIGTILADAGVVESDKAFVRAAKANSDATSIQAGSYQLPTHIPGAEAVTTMLDPASRVQRRVTLREGLTLEKQLDAIAEQSGLPRADFEKLADKPDGLGLPKYAKGLEGYLFPDTYDFEDDATAKDILTTMVKQYVKVADEVGLEKAAGTLDRSPADLVTVASIIEAEVFNDADRPKVARVLYNRLDQGMKLQLDTTVKYANGLDGKVTTTDQERAKDSPYNTYLHEGLPPGPIGAPGKAALDAAAHPADGDWLYFVAVNLETGETKFASTFEEHQQYVSEFQAWCQANKDKGLC